MDRYTQVLQELIRNTCLEGASLVSADGLPIASVLKPGMEENRIAAMGAAILSLGERVSEELAKGSLEQITIKGHNNTFTAPITPITIHHTIHHKLPKPYTPFLPFSECPNLMHTSKAYPHIINSPLPIT